MMSIDGVSPPGWDKAVERLKERPGVEEPFALAWYLYNQGVKPGDIESDTAKLDALWKEYASRQRAGTMTEEVPLAARGILWAQAQIIARVQGQAFHVYRERPW